MRAYAQIVPTFWTRGSGKRLRDDREARLLALYFMTCPSSSMLGIFYLPLTTIIHETGFSAEEIRAVLPRISEIVRYDEEAELAWLPQGAKHQIGAIMAPKDRRRAAIARELQMVADHPFAAEFLRLYGTPYGLDDLISDEDPAEAPSEGASAAPSRDSVSSDFDPDPWGLSGEVAAEGAAAAPLPVLSCPASGSGSGSENRSDPPDRSRPRPKPAPGRKRPAAPVLLEPDWRPDPELVAALATKHSVDERQILALVREFVWYWTRGKGAGTRRADWDATFRKNVDALAKRGEIPALANSVVTLDRAARDRDMRARQAEEQRRREAARPKGKPVPMPADLRAALPGLLAPPAPAEPEPTGSEA